MSYTNPSTAGTGGTVLAALWNTDVKDNLSYLYSQGTARSAESSSLAGSITVAQNYVDDITYQPIGTISGTSIYTVGTSNANYLYQVNPGSGTTKIVLGTSNLTGTKVDFVQTGSGTVLFDIEWIAGDSSNEIWTSIASSENGTKVVATTTFVPSISSGYIYTSTDSGATWTERTGSGSRDWQEVASSADGTKLVATVNAGQIYTSTDSGVTWTARETNRAWTSVASSSDGTKLVATVSAGQIYTSTDSGVNWTARNSNRSWSSVASSADGTKLVAAVSGGQLYTSTDSGVNWTARETNQAWSSVASSSDGTKLVAVVNGSFSLGYIYTSKDSGVTWTARENDRPWNSVASSADGTKLIASAGSEYIYISMDSGVTWFASTSIKNYNCVASSSDGTKLFAGVVSNKIYNSSLGLIFTPSNQLRTQYSAASVLKINNTNWLLFGDLA